MSQLELIRELRGAKPAAPAELRERLRLLAVQAPPHEPPRRWRRALVIGVPVLAAAIAAGVVFIPRGSQHQTDIPYRAAVVPRSSSLDKLGAVGAATSRTGLPAPSGKRLQRYTASLSLQVKNNAAVSNASKEAVAITHALGGYQQSGSITADSGTGYANLELRVP